MSVNLITLGREAVISDPAVKIDRLMCCFFFSKHNQTTMFKNRVVSLMKLIQTHTDDPVNLKEDIQATLTRFLERFFTRVQVDVNVVQETETNRLGLTLDVVVSDTNSIDNNAISLGYALTYESTILREILETYSGRNLLNQKPTWS